MQPASHHAELCKRLGLWWQAPQCGRTGPPRPDLCWPLWLHPLPLLWEILLKWPTALEAHFVLLLPECFHLNGPLFAWWIASHL